MIRTLDATFLNSVANHPEVHPWLGAPGEIDLAPFVSDPKHFALVNEGGGFLLICHEPGVYEVHSQFLPNHRRQTIKAMRDGFDYMFINTDCHTVLTQVPDNNVAAAALARHAHFRPMFRREETPRGSTAFMALTIDQWAQDNTGLEAEGEWFHDRLSAAKEANGSSLPEHAHDAAHERAVGATIRMVKAGNCHKAVAFYNRWARFAGYVPITLLGDTPPLIDVVDAVVELNGQEMEIILCRSV